MRDGPTTVQSKLGYLLFVPLALSVSSNTATNMHIGIHENENQTLERFWAIESSGTFSTVKNSDRFMDTFLSSIT